MTKFQKRLLAKAGVFAGSFLLFVAIVIIPKYIERNHLVEEVKQLSGENLQVRKMIMTSQKLGERLQDIVSQLDYYRNRVPSRESLPEILDEIATKAEQYQLHVLTLQPLGDKPFSSTTEGLPIPEEEKNVQELIVGMKARGSFVQLGRYFSELEMAPHAILIKEVDIKNQKADSRAAETEPVLEIDLKFKVLMKQTPNLPSK